MRARKTCSWRDEETGAGCPHVAVIAPSGDDFRCERHQRRNLAHLGDKHRAVPPLSEAEKDFVRERDWHACRECGEPAHEVDHIVEVADNGTNHPSNLQLLCDIHHDRKSRESQERWKPDVRRGTSARAQAKRRARKRGLYQQ